MTMFVVDAGDRRATFLDEPITHDGRMPFPFRVVFRLTSSYGGIARNRLWTWVFGKDRRGLGRFVHAELEAHPPTLVLLSHGQPISDVAAVKAQLAPIA